MDFEFSYTIVTNIKKKQKVIMIRQWHYAIADTLKSVVGSSLTTIAGFLALCTMSLTLGKDIGLVMAKGVALGVISTVTILPSLILVFDKLITKTAHKDILPKFTE